MSAKELHKKAEEARESGNFLEALKISDEALIAYQGEANLAKFAEVLCVRCLTFRHLFEKTNDLTFARLAKFEAKAAVGILEKNDSKEGLGIAYYNLAKAYETLEKFEKEKEAIHKSLESFESAPQDSQNKPSVTSEIETRLAVVEYRLGDDTAIERFNTSLSELKNSNEDDYVKKVWISGAYLHLADAMIARGEKDKASEQLTKAKSIIEGDERLKLRIGQLAKLSAKLS